jgi:DNA (cytosine-5)-methyltransferase 1
MVHGNFYEFFAGGGMVRAGLGKRWKCLFANDFDPKKAGSYAQNWGNQTLHVGDVNLVRPEDLPGEADLVWASFPCQDLSLAGAGAGLKGERSGTFWPFWKLVKTLNAEGRGPTIIALENVCGALTSHGGKDFAAICSALEGQGYNFGALVIDAVRFLPQSRPRLFIIGVRENVAIPQQMVTDVPSQAWHTSALLEAHSKLSRKCADRWVWWNLREPADRNTTFADVLEDNPDDVKWHTREQTQTLLAMMSPVNKAKVEAAQRSGRRTVGTIYKRTRVEEAGVKAQRAEIRFDDIAGCLRTPAGGSSRQLIMVVEGRKIRSRLISSRETARLMGLDENYILPAKYNDAYHLTGDGVAVPVVRHLADTLFEPIIRGRRQDREAA